MQENLVKSLIVKTVKEKFDQSPSKNLDGFDGIELHTFFLETFKDFDGNWIIKIFRQRLIFCKCQQIKV